MIVEITVYQKRIEAKETLGYTYRQDDAQCTVDGELYQFIFKKDSLNSNKAWREQAYNYAFYHARNAGEHVLWIKSNRKPKKAKPVNPKQKGLFDNE